MGGCDHSRRGQRRDDFVIAWNGLRRFLFAAFSSSPPTHGSSRRRRQDVLCRAAGRIDVGMIHPGQLLNKAHVLRWLKASGDHEIPEHGR